MPAKRKFDWDEAARLYREERWSYQRIADHFGVNIAAIYRAINGRGPSSPPKEEKS